MIRLIAFDLDGTLTQHKTKLEEKNREILTALAKKYRLLMVGAGACRRIFEQLEHFPIDVIGNYGLEFSRYSEEARDIIPVFSHKFDCDRESVLKRINALRKKFGFTEYAGESVEYHASGCVTFPILGTAAKIEDKLSFDPTREKRRGIYREVCEVFSDYTVFVGGTSSFDMSPRPFDKCYALNEYCKTHGFSHDEVVFVGDDYGEGGNDESVYRSDFKFICVDDYRKLDEYLAELL